MIGSSTIYLESTLQIRPLSKGQVHVVLRAGRYGGLVNYKVGFQVFWMCLEALKNLNQGSTGSSEKSFIEKPFYDDLFFEFQDKKG